MSELIRSTNDETDVNLGTVSAHFELLNLFGLEKPFSMLRLPQFHGVEQDKRVFRTVLASLQMRTP